MPQLAELWQKRHPPPIDGAVPTGGAIRCAIAPYAGCSEHRHSSGNFWIGSSRDLPVWLLATTAMMFGAGMAFMKWLSM